MGGGKKAKMAFQFGPGKTAVVLGYLGHFPVFIFHFEEAKREKNGRNQGEKQGDTLNTEPKNEKQKPDKMAFYHTAEEGQRSLIFPFLLRSVLPFSFPARCHLLREASGSAGLSNRIKDVYTCSVRPRDWLVLWNCA